MWFAEAIEAEFADWRPSSPSTKGGRLFSLEQKDIAEVGACSMQPHAGRVYDLASGERNEHQKFYQLEEEESFGNNDSEEDPKEVCPQLRQINGVFTQVW